jgi:hypothetical protein
MFIAIEISSYVYYLVFILKSIINFEGDNWIHTQVDKNGKKTVVVRHVDDKGQQMIVSYFLKFSIIMNYTFL